MKPNKQKILTLLSVMALTLSSAAQATLFSRGTDMVYDDVLDVTWLKDANYAQTSGHDVDGRMNWAAANAWAGGLTVGGYTDWRLTDVKPVNNTAFNDAFSYNGSTDIGYNNNSTQSEMGYMFFQNLGNLSVFNTSGVLRSGSSGVDWGVTNTGLFDNLQNFVYWSAVEYAPNTLNAWGFNTNFGFQHNDPKGHEFYAWAVRSGDVTVVPVPAAVWFMGSALFGLVGFARKR